MKRLILPYDDYCEICLICVENPCSATANNIMAIIVDLPTQTVALHSARLC